MKTHIAFRELVSDPAQVRSSLQKDSKAEELKIGELTLFPERPGRVHGSDPEQEWSAGLGPFLLDFFVVSRWRL